MSQTSSSAVLPARRQPLAAPGQELLGHLAHGRPSTKRSQSASRPARAGTPQQPVAGQRLGVGVVVGDRLLHQPQRLRRRPGVQGGLGQPAPPDLVAKPSAQSGSLLGQADQAVARAFFRAYAGSGLVIQRLARCQRTPSRASVARIVSPLTRVGGQPLGVRGLGRPGPASTGWSGGRSRAGERWQQLAQPLRPRRVEGGVDGVRAGGAAAERRHARAIEGVDGVAHRLVAAAEAGGRWPGRARHGRWRARSGSGATVKASAERRPAARACARRRSADAQTEGLA